MKNNKVQREQIQMGKLFYVLHDSGIIYKMSQTSFFTLYYNTVLLTSKKE